MSDLRDAALEAAGKNARFALAALANDPWEGMERVVAHALRDFGCPSECGEAAVDAILRALGGDDG